MILADTSVWIEHLRQGQSPLAPLLERRQILLHPWVIGELACGNLKYRRQLLDDLANMPQTIQASDMEAMTLLDRHNLSGRGIGWIDLHLAASALLAGCKLWTLDQRLEKVAQELGVAYAPPLH